MQTTRKVHRGKTKNKSESHILAFKKKEGHKWHSKGSKENEKTIVSEVRRIEFLKRGTVNNVKCQGEVREKLDAAGYQ